MSRQLRHTEADARNLAVHAGQVADVPSLAADVQAVALMHADVLALLVELESQNRTILERTKPTP